MTLHTKVRCAAQYTVPNGVIASKLRIVIAKAVKIGNEAAANICRAISLLKGTRDWKSSKFTSTALDILTDAFRIVNEQAIPVLGELLEETIFISSLDECLSRHALHRWLFSALLSSTIPNIHTYNYYEGRHKMFSGDLEWNLVAFRGLSKISTEARNFHKSEKPSDHTVDLLTKVVEDVRILELDILYRAAMLCVNTAPLPPDTDNVLKLYKSKADSLDEVLPDSDEIAKIWGYVRLEHVARLKLLQGLKGLIELRNADLDVMALRSEQRPQKIGELLRLFTSSLSYRPGQDPANGLHQTDIADRLSRTSHALLSFFTFFTNEFLCSPQTRLPYRPPGSPNKNVSPDRSFADFEELPTPRDVDAGIPAGIGYPIPVHDLPHALAGQEDRTWPPKFIKSMRWVAAKSDSKHGEAKSKNKLDFIEAERRSFVANAWDLERYHVDDIGVILTLFRIVTIASWHVSTGRVRLWLREVFERMAEKPVSYSTLSDRPIPRRPTPTIVDMEAFLIILIAQRMHQLVLEKFAANSGDILYLAALKSWKPSDLQRGFWNFSLTYFSKCSQGPYLAANALSEHQYFQALHEIRGELRPQSRFQKIIFAYIGVTFADMVVASHERLTNIQESPMKIIPAPNASAYVEALHYLTVLSNWDGGDATAGWIKMENGTIILVDGNAAEYDNVSSPVENQAFDLSKKLKGLPLPSPERFGKKRMSMNVKENQTPSSIFSRSPTPSKTRYSPAFLPVSGGSPSLRNGSKGREYDDFAMVSASVSVQTSPSAGGKNVKGIFSRGLFNEPVGAADKRKLESDSDDGWVRDGYSGELEEVGTAADELLKSVELTAGELVSQRVMLLKRTGGSAEGGIRITEEPEEKEEDDDDAPPPITLLDEVLSAQVAEIKQERHAERRRKLDLIRQASTPAPLRRFSSIDASRPLNFSSPESPNTRLAPLAGLSPNANAGKQPLRTRLFNEDSFASKSGSPLRKGFSPAASPGFLKPSVKSSAFSPSFRPAFPRQVGQDVSLGGNDVLVPSVKAEPPETLDWDFADLSVADSENAERLSVYSDVPEPSPFVPGTGTPLKSRLQRHMEILGMK
ncbi:hypothetical protein HDU97_003964 [Phlyctochytrium planicorne]|nr:hypothetical protein HDU97_003964 [Phlyctochytrium planicorne]